MSEISTRAFEEFDALASLFGRTRSVLDELMTRGGLSTAGASVLASQTLPHIEDVEAGFKAQLRTSESDIDELRGLVLQGGLGRWRPEIAVKVKTA